ncbi:MAG TPA: PIN domain-containing protein [Candidatus Altiarchaeales archaeon]|nr:PIN domain-containing protein [Candidatus Altiarchaeales archaeon]
MLKSIDEVIGAIWRESDREKAIKEGLRILEFPNLRVLSVESKHLHSGMNLMKRYKELKPRDAIHLAVSLRAGVFRIVSDDPDFDDVKEIEREKLA